MLNHPACLSAQDRENDERRELIYSRQLSRVTEVCGSYLPSVIARPYCTGSSSTDVYELFLLYTSFFNAKFRMGILCSEKLVAIEFVPFSRKDTHLNTANYKGKQTSRRME